MIEKEYQYGSVSIKYMFQQATSDIDHLVVVFTGFDIAYDFKNVGQSFKCNVLWVRDDYEGHECYYLGKDGAFKFRDGINDLIQFVLKGKNLSNRECTLLGGSKGGYSALYFGLKYNYKNIISSAFTSLIGTRMVRMVKNRPQVAKFVMGNKFDEAKVEIYNNLLKEVIIDDVFIDKNIYVFVSKDDGYYDDNQKPLLPLLEKYHNFNVVESTSDLIKEHRHVTPYNLPLIIAFVNSLSENLAPSFQFLKNGKKGNSYNKLDVEYSPVTFLKKVYMLKDVLYIEGDAFLKNIGSEKTDKYKKVLSLVNKRDQYKYRLDTIINIRNSAKYFDGYYVDYTASGFSTLNKEGVDLSKVECGSYDLLMDLEIKDLNLRSNCNLMVETIGLDKKYQNDGIEYRIWESQGKVRLSKRRLFDDLSTEQHFSISTIKFIDKHIFHIEGVYAIPGIEIVDWQDAKYYLYLQDQENKGNRIFYNLGKQHKQSLNQSINNGFGIYHKAYFATLKKEGVSVANLVDGKYDIYVILSYKGSVFNQKAHNVLCIEAGLSFLS